MSSVSANRTCELVFFHFVALTLTNLRSSAYRLSIQTCVRCLFALSAYSSLLWFYAFLVGGPRIKWHSEKRFEPSAAAASFHRSVIRVDLLPLIWINRIVEGFSSWPWHTIVWLSREGGKKKKENIASSFSETESWTGPLWCQRASSVCWVTTPPTWCLICPHRLPHIVLPYKHVKGSTTHRF